MGHSGGGGCWGWGAHATTGALGQAWERNPTWTRVQSRAAQAQCGHSARKELRVLGGSGLALVLLPLGQRLCPSAPSLPPRTTLIINSPLEPTRQDTCRHLAGSRAGTDSPLVSPPGGQSDWRHKAWGQLSLLSWAPMWVAVPLSHLPKPCYRVHGEPVASAETAAAERLWGFPAPQLPPGPGPQPQLATRPVLPLPSPHLSLGPPTAALRLALITML